MLPFTSGVAWVDPWIRVNPCDDEVDDGECWEDVDEKGEVVGDDHTGFEVDQLLRAAVLVVERLNAEAALRRSTPHSVLPPYGMGHCGV